MVRISLSQKHLKEYEKCQVTLKQIFNDLMDIWPIDEIYITCIYRTPEEDKKLHASGVHATIPHRAIDVRITTLPGDYQLLANKISNDLNARWSYDFTRPRLKVAYTKPHGTGPHIHLQVHYQTRRIL